MPRVNTIQTNMTAGEMSPRLLGRVDIARYQNALGTMENAYPLVHGGGQRRPGLQYIIETKTSAKRARVLPFIFSTTQAFVFEFGDLYVRFYTAKAQIGPGYEIASPYTEAELVDLNYAQAGDTVFLFHSAHPIHTLKRVSNALWVLVPYALVVEPHDELGISPNTTITLSSAAVGVGVTATAAAAAFQPADLGRPFTSGTGIGVITAFTSALIVVITITQAFAGVALASGAWTLGESPKTSATPSVSGPIGAAVTVTLGANGWQNDAVRTDIGRYLHIDGGVIEITGYSSVTVVTGLVRALLAGTTGASSGYWSEESKIWNAAKGYPRCGTLFQQRLVVAGTTDIPNGLWGSKTGVYNDFTPGTAADDGFDFRMVSGQENPVQQLAATKWLLIFSSSSELSLNGGTDSPLTPLNAHATPESGYGSKNVRPVRVGNELLYVQRAGRKIRAASWDLVKDSVLSPDVSILSEHITGPGIVETCYAQEPDSVMPMVRTDGQMPTLTINREQEVLGWARQVTDGAIESLCSIPYGDLDQVWCIVKRTINGAIRRNVELLEFQNDHTTNRQTDSSVVGSFAPINNTALSWAAGVISLSAGGAHGLAPGGFARISGAVPAAYNGDYAVITTPSGSQLTFSREANPGVCTTLGTVTPLAVAWGGLSHLEAKTVDVLADGVVFPQATVTAGSVTLPRAVASVEIGLHYKTTLVTLPPELQLPEGTPQGRPVSINECTVRLYKSIGCKVENEQVPFRAFGDAVLDTPIAPFTGDKQVPILGWARGRVLTIVQDQPLPLCVLAIIKRVTVGD